MRWLLLKDLQILRRSKLLVGMLVVYPIAIALMIGFALSSPPGKPKVAYFSAVPNGKGTIDLGSQKLDIANYAKTLFTSIEPVIVHSRAAAVADVRSGRTLAAVIVPADITAQVESLVRSGVGQPTVQLLLNSKDPLERQYVKDAINSRLAAVEGAVSKQVLAVAVSDLQQVLSGGVIQFFGRDFQLLGLRASKQIVDRAARALPPASESATQLKRVSDFAQLAIEGLAFANPVLGRINAPLTIDQRQLSGRTTPTDTYAVAIAVVVSLMFVTLLLAAGMLAIERSENAYARLVRGLVTPLQMLAEKVVLAAAAAGLLALVMAACVSAFVHLEWGRFGLWAAAVACAAAAFAALGAAIGAVAREVSAASLMAFLLSLPIAFVALVPGDAVSSGVKTLLDVVAFAFPFKSALEAVDNAFAGTQPAIGLPLVHLAALALMFTALARLALTRFARP